MKKIEELIPDILRKLSQGIAISIKDIARLNNLSADGIKKKLNDVRKKFYNQCFYYDNSTKKWKVGKNMKGFLKYTLLSPEEAVALSALHRTKDRLGNNLIDVNEKIIDSFIIDINKKLNKEIKFDYLLKILLDAIQNKQVVEIDILDNCISYSETVYPLRIIYIDEHWHIIYSKKNKILLQKIILIKSVKILEKSFIYDYSDIDLRLKYLINDFIDFNQPIKIISVLIKLKILDQLKLTNYFNSWKEINYKIILNDEAYCRYEIKITNPDFDDILPIILKYMPNIIVEDPKELIEKIEKIISYYRAFYTHD